MGNRVIRSFHLLDIIKIKQLYTILLNQYILHFIIRKTFYTRYLYTATSYQILSPLEYFYRFIKTNLYLIIDSKQKETLIYPLRNILLCVVQKIPTVYSGVLSIQPVCQW